MGHVGTLLLLDKLAAFNTVDHTILLDVQDGVFKAVLQLISDFLSQCSSVSKSAIPHQTLASDFRK
jgi:hypothetical protein